MSSTSNQFCDTIRISWLSQTNLTGDELCSDCILGSLQTQLGSPFGYDEDRAEDFASLTSSCSKTNYAFTTPSVYSLDTTTTAPPVTTPICASTYVVQTDDTCNSIALSQSISTFSLYNTNGIWPSCGNLAIGDSLCIKDTCTTYEVQSSDTCDSILLGLSNTITGSQLLAWNPNINALCANLHDFEETVICVR
jgi:hypothetical protein